MSGPRVTLHSVTRISGTSVFLTPREEETLDFRTINSAPPSHRSVLQKNGLTAKICIGLTFIDTGTDELSPEELKEYTYSFEGRLKLWRNALVKSKLIEENPSSVNVPAALSKKPWPLLSEEVFSRRMHYYAERKKCSEVHTSSFCVPSVSLQQTFYKEPGLKASIGIVWMPRYKYDLIEWCELRLNGGRWIPEQHLTTLIHHTAVGLSAIKKLMGEMNSASVTALESGTVESTRVTFYAPVTFEMDDVLVHEGDNAPVFSVTLSPLADDTKIAAAVANEDYVNLSLYPYLAPEQVYSSGTPERFQRYDVWALGAMIYAIASGTPSLASQIRRQSKRREYDMPMNHPCATPAHVIRRVRRDLEPGGYSSAMASMISLLLSQDHLTRPSWATVDRMMQDLNRVIPLYRFPFVIGSYDLLRLPTPDLVQLNPTARKYITSDICCVCRKERNLANCTIREHTPAVASPSWCNDEPLPGINASNEACHMAYLYPLMPPLANDRDTRRLLLQALPRHSANSHNLNATSNSENVSYSSNGESGINLGQIFQFFGGFSIYEKRVKDGRERACVREVLVPFPSNCLRRAQYPGLVQQLHFAAAHPWPSECTKVLQKRGRISRQVPFMFGGSHSAVKWFAWLVPEEVFTLANGQKWTPAPDGGFVFWFNELLDPSDQDRFFPLTSIRSLSINTKVHRTVQPDHMFRPNRDDAYHVNSMHLSLSGADAMPPSSLTRGRCGQHVRDVDIPHCQDIYEDEEALQLPSSRKSRTPVNPRCFSKTDILHNNSAPCGPTSRQRPQTGRTPPLRVSPINDNICESIVEVHGGPTVEAFIDEKHPISFMSIMAGSRDVSTPVAQNTRHQRNATAHTPLVSLNANQCVKQASEELTALTTEQSPINSECRPSTVLSVQSTPRRSQEGDNGSLPTSRIQIQGQWLPAGGMHSPFGCLSFFIEETGEFGLLQRPFQVSEAIRSSLRCPPAAHFLSFATNSVPMMRRNHGLEKVRVKKMLLPHHGFVAYNCEYALVGVMALRCCLADHLPTDSTAPPLALRALPPQRSDVSPAEINAGFFSMSPSDSASVAAFSVKSGKGGLHHETMSPNYLRHGVTHLGLCAESDVLTWVGFDPKQATLMFSDMSQATWYPMALVA